MASKFTIPEFIRANYFKIRAGINNKLIRFIARFK